MNRVFSPGASIVVIKAFSQRVRGDTDNGVYLGIKIVRAAEGLNSNVVFLDVGRRSFEVLFANIGQKPNEIVRSTEHSRVQNGFKFGAFRLKPADG